MHFYKHCFNFFWDRVSQVLIKYVSKTNKNSKIARCLINEFELRNGPTIFSLHNRLIHVIFAPMASEMKNLLKLLLRREIKLQVIQDKMLDFMPKKKKSVRSNGIVQFILDIARYPKDDDAQRHLRSHSHTCGNSATNWIGDGTGKLVGSTFFWTK